MKQARRWLLLAAALVLLPQAAYAQKKKPEGRSRRPAPAAAPAGDTRRSGRRGRRSADAALPERRPRRPRAAISTGDDRRPAETPAAAAWTSARSRLTRRSARRPKKINLGDEAKKTVHAEVYAVQQQYVIKAQRFEISRTSR